MDMENETQVVTQEPPKPIGESQVKKFTKFLREYKAGKKRTEARIIASEQWWKLRNTSEEQKKTEIGADGGFVSSSAWLHNVITSKHADAIESYPEPNILPREEGDKGEAEVLTSIVPCILDQNHFEGTYDKVMWAKMKSGTGAYKVVWDKNLLNGLGDVRVDKVNLLNVFWEPGLEDIQQSRYFFQTELVDRDVLVQKYPQLDGKLKGNDLFSARFLYDDTVPTANKATVVECYYHVYQGPRRILHYCKYVGDQVLFATENETDHALDELGNVIAEPMAQTGLYDHGEYPFVFDPLFPVEGSPCGYGFVDLGMNPQTSIDLMNTAFVKNAMVGAIPRFITSNDTNVNEKEFLNTSNPIIHVTGSVDEMSLRNVPHQSLDGNYLNLMEMAVKEMRETTGNTDASTGSTPSGVTAASAIAALQEASGKGSRDSTLGSYRAYGKVTYFVIELIRQFYNLPRMFRIAGDRGAQKFVEYSNRGLMQKQMGLNGVMSIRKAEFDIKVQPQRRSAYTKVSNNEMAIQFYQMGFFNPNMAEQSLMCLEMMDFDSKDSIMQMVQKNAMVFQKFAFYVQQCFMMAQAMGNGQLAMQCAADMQMHLGMAAPAGAGGMKPVNLSGGDPAESGITQRAREQASNASKPKEG